MVLTLFSLGFSLAALTYKHTKAGLVSADLDYFDLVLFKTWLSDFQGFEITSFNKKSVSGKHEYYYFQ